MRANWLWLMILFSWFVLSPAVGFWTGLTAIIFWSAVGWLAWRVFRRDEPPGLGQYAFKRFLGVYHVVLVANLIAAGLHRAGLWTWTQYPAGATLLERARYDWEQQDWNNFLETSAFSVVGTIYLVIALRAADQWARSRAISVRAAGAAQFATLDGNLDRKALHRITQAKGIYLGFAKVDRLPTFVHRIIAVWWLPLVSSGVWGPVPLARYHYQPLRYDGESHLITCAKTRSGKGRDVIIPNLLTLDGMSVFCIDPKGQNAAVTKRFRESVSRVFLINPFDELGLGTSRFNPLAGLDIASPNVVPEVASFAEALIVTESQTQPYFDSSARDLVKVLLLHLLEEKGKEATLLDMRALVALPYEAPPDRPSLLKKLAEIEERTRHKVLRELVGRFLGDAKSLHEVVQAAQKQTEFLSHPEIANVLSGDDVRMEWLKDSPTTLYVIMPERHMAAYSGFFRLLIVRALSALTARTTGVRTLMVLDEFTTASGGRLPAIENAFGLAAGYGVQLWLIVQNLSQLSKIYGETGVENFMSGAEVMQWFGTNDMYTAKKLSDQLGRRGRRTKDRIELGSPLLTPQQVMALSDGEQIITLAGVGGTKAMRAPYYGFPARRVWREDWPDFSGLYDRDPFHAAR